MSEEKRSRGRPRIHATNAARKKAYRERKKEERLQMEIRIKKLEKKLGIIDTSKEFDEKESVMNLTYHKLGILKTEKLEEYLQQLRMKIKEDISIYSLFDLIIDSLDEFQQKAQEYDDNIIIHDIDEKFQENREQIQNILLQHMINFELAKRKEIKYAEIELELIEERIKELEKKITKEKEISKEVITKKE